MDAEGRSECEILMGLIVTGVFEFHNNMSESFEVPGRGRWGGVQSGGGKGASCGGMGVREERMVARGRGGGDGLTL